MTNQIAIILEHYGAGPSQPFHKAGSKYQYREAASLTDGPARLTERQAVFLRNLVRLAECLQTEELPLDFIDGSGQHVAMDLGCVKIAEHMGFIRPLTNDETGLMRTITLSWKVVP